MFSLGNHKRGDLKYIRVSFPRLGTFYQLHVSRIGLLECFLVVSVHGDNLSLEGSTSKISRARKTN